MNCFAPAFQLLLAVFVRMFPSVAAALLFTHAVTVKFDPKLKLPALLTFTYELLPPKLNPPSIFPALHAGSGLPDSVPLFPLLVESGATVPLPAPMWLTIRKLLSQVPVLFEGSVTTAAFP